MTGYEPDAGQRRAGNGRYGVPSVSGSAGAEATAPPKGGGRATAAVWVAGGAVAAGAAIATAHGLYEVAAASGVPPGIAWIYPLITDGLALVAYAATSRLTGRAARYAWSVVVLAAGLSGLAQAAYLAAGPAVDAVGPGPLVRFGVGAWPAVAAAIVAHLLYLLATPAAVPDERRPPDGARAATLVDASMSTRSTADDRALSAVPGVHAHRAVTAAAAHEPTPSTGVSSDHPDTVHARLHPPTRDEPAEPSGTPGTPRERASRAATAHLDASGAWPSVRDLAASANVSTGLAGNVLRDLRTATTSTETTDENPS